MMKVSTRSQITKTELQTQNFEICKFKGLLQIQIAILNYLVCNMMKVFRFTRPTSASDFYFPNMKYGKLWYHLQKKKKSCKFSRFWAFKTQSEIFFPSVMRRCRRYWRCQPVVGRNLNRRYLSRLRGFEDSGVKKN
jgi:hypothetical protein